MNREYSKEEINKIKNSLSIEQVFDLVSELGGEPKMMEGYFISKTICHNPSGEGSHKLYYYDNTKLFNCYTSCGDRFDIFDLIHRHMNTIGEKRQYVSKDGKLVERDWQIFDSIEFVLLFFNISLKNKNFLTSQRNTQYEDYLDKLTRNLENFPNKKRVEMKIYDEKILNFLSCPIIEPWIKEGISQEIIEKRNIKFDYKNYGVVIPHYDINNNLIGIRERTFSKENEQYGKYRPAIFNGIMYSHPLGFNLYNLNNSKDNIRRLGKAIVFEGEKYTFLSLSFSICKMGIIILTSPHTL